MPRVLQVSTIAATLNRFIVPIAKHFRDMGWEVDAAANGVESDEVCLDSFHRCYDVPFSRSILSPANVTTAAKRIGRIARSGKYDIVHVHTPIAAFMTRRVLRKRPASQKVVYTAHGFHFYDGGSPLRNRAFETLEKTAAPWMDHLIVMNQQDCRNALRLKLATPETITFMHGIGIDLNEFTIPSDAAQIRARLRREVGIPDDAHVFLMIAGYTKNKRHCDAIRALAMLPGPNQFQLVLAGDGDMLQPSMALARELGVEKRIHFLGYRADIPELLVASDVLMLISEREGLPRSIMEALAFEKSVVGTKIRGISDLLDRGVGMLCPPCDPAELSKSMVASVDFQPDIIARAEVLKKCSMSNILDQHKKLYDQLLGQSAPVSTASPNSSDNVLIG